MENSKFLQINVEEILERRKEDKEFREHFEQAAKSLNHLKEIHQAFEEQGLKLWDYIEEIIFNDDQTICKIIYKDPKNTSSPQNYAGRQQKQKKSRKNREEKEKEKERMKRICTVHRRYWSSPVSEIEDENGNCYYVKSNCAWRAKRKHKNLSNKRIRKQAKRGDPHIYRQKRRHCHRIYDYWWEID